jgi:archaellum component FlaF (FlaF/FlaG flagellin family)
MRNEIIFGATMVIISAIYNLECPITTRLLRLLLLAVLLGISQYASAQLVKGAVAILDTNYAIDVKKGPNFISWDYERQHKAVERSMWYIGSTPNDSDDIEIINDGEHIKVYSIDGTKSLRAYWLPKGALQIFTYSPKKPALVEKRGKQDFSSEFNKNAFSAWREQLKDKSNKDRAILAEQERIRKAEEQKATMQGRAVFAERERSRKLEEQKIEREEQTKRSWAELADKSFTNEFRDTFTKKGEGTLLGQAFFRTRGGDVKLGAGCEVILSPASAYIGMWKLQEQKMANLVRAHIEFARATKSDVIPVDNDTGRIDTRYLPLLRTTMADANGNFEFKNLPPGDYMLFCTITWLVSADNESGGTTFAFCTIDDKETQKVLLTQTISAELIPEKYRDWRLIF